jgi:Glycosyl hydrolase family 63 C-terminal domain
MLLWQMPDQQWRELESAAASILASNDTGTFVKPGPRQYPGQWNWDSALIAIGLAHLDPDRARNEVRSLLSGQWDDGMVPHIVFHSESVEYFPGPTVWGTTSANPVIPTSGVTQPPLLATAVRILNERDPSPAFLAEVVPRLELWHRWFQSRRLGGDGLVAILHPWESGMDNSPRFDAALAKLTPAIDFTRRDLAHVAAEQRPTDADYGAYVSILEKLRAQRYRPSLDDACFLVGDVFLTSVLARAEADLAHLFQVIGESGSEPQARSDSLKTALEGSWDPKGGLFTDRGGDPDTATIAGVLPLIAGVDRTASDRLVEALVDPERFGAGEGAPWYPTSVSKSDPRFDPGRYWRGPVWVNINWLLVRGLDAAGYAEEADRLRSHTLRLVSDHGFWEYYDPRSGRGLGCGSFSWTAAVILDLLKRG